MWPGKTFGCHAGQERSRDARRPRRAERRRTETHCRQTDPNGGRNGGQEPRSGPAQTRRFAQLFCAGRCTLVKCPRPTAWPVVVPGWCRPRCRTARPRPARRPSTGRTPDTAGTRRSHGARRRRASRRGPATTPPGHRSGRRRDRPPRAGQPTPAIPRRPAAARPMVRARAALLCPWAYCVTPAMAGGGGAPNGLHDGRSRCGGIRAMYRQFRHRPLDPRPYTFVATDALVLKAAGWSTCTPWWPPGSTATGTERSAACSSPAPRRRQLA